MWRFLSNVKEPPKKKTSEEKRGANRKYDNESRKRTFQERWKEGREWLEYSESEGNMRCKVCRLHPRTDADRKASFFVGCISIRLDSIENMIVRQIYGDFRLYPFLAA